MLRNLPAFNHRPLGFSLNLLFDPAWLFLLVGGVFGVIFVFLFPTAMVIDEPSHFYRAYQISQFDIVGSVNKGNGEVGGDIPVSILDMFGHAGYPLFRYENKAEVEVLAQDAKRPLESGRVGFIGFKNTVIYPPFTYAPQAAGIFAARASGASALATLHTARLSTLAFYLVCVFFAIRILPVGKWAAFTIALFPMALSQAASSSADGTINALCFLTIALIVRGWFSDRLGARYLIALGTLGVLLALTKIPYLLVVLLALGLPARAFPQKRFKYLFLGLLFAVMTVIVLAWNAGTAPLHQELRPTITSVHDQAATIWHHPLIYLKAVVLYPLTREMDGSIVQTYGLLGWNDTRVPLWLAIAGFFAVAAGLISPHDTTKCLTAWRRSLSLLVGALIVGSIATLIYLSWIEVGGRYLYALWGRYFSAILPLAIPLAAGALRLDAQSWRRVKPLIAASAPIALGIVVFMVWNRYYYFFNLG